MRTVLYIDNIYCLSLTQLRDFFLEELIPGTPLYEDLLIAQRDGELAKWLAEGVTDDEMKLLKKLKNLPTDISNSELVNRLKQLFVDDAQKIQKPHFSDFIEFQQIRCKVNDAFIDVEEFFPNQYQVEMVDFSKLCKVKFFFDFKVIKSDDETFDVGFSGTTYSLSLKNKGIGKIETIESKTYVLKKTEGFALSIDGETMLQIMLRVNKRVIYAGDVGFTMIRIQGGTFTMGATPEQWSYAKDNERPAHQVTLDTFYIGQFEVTQELWTAVMGDNPSDFKGANRPVENVNWDDPHRPGRSCQEFIRKLNKLTGKNFRLPTEAEWEYAARGGNRSKGCIYAGSNKIDEVAWRAGFAGSHHSVGQKRPNELDLYDMSGNVFEWCQDWKGDYSSSNQINPQGPNTGYARVIRGGGWGPDVSDCRVSYRDSQPPNTESQSLGLRLVM